MQGMFQIPPFDAPPTKTTVSTKEKNDRQTRNEPTIKKKKRKDQHPSIFYSKDAAKCK
jgi:hypothetical protein